MSSPTSHPLTGFIGGPQQVMQRYPSSDQTMPARYARAIAMFRRGDIQNALPIIDGLIKELPENPYFWELKAQALLENGRAVEACANGIVLLSANAQANKSSSGDVPNTGPSRSITGLFQRPD